MDRGGKGRWGGSEVSDVVGEAGTSGSHRHSEELGFPLGKPGAPGAVNKKRNIRPAGGEHAVVTAGKGGRRRWREWKWSQVFGLGMNFQGKANRLHRRPGWRV